MDSALSRLMFALAAALAGAACSSSSNKTTSDASSQGAGQDGAADAGLDASYDASDGGPQCAIPVCMTSPELCVCTPDGGISCPGGLVPAYDGGANFCASAGLCCPASDYCLESYIGANSGVGCAPLPAACESTQTCACWTAQMASDPTFASCTCTDSGGVVFVSCPPSKN